MRLIDADAVEKQAYDDVHYHAELEDWEFDVVTHYLDHAPTIEAVVLPCKIGDEVWGIRNYRGVKHPQRGRVNDMFFTKDMRLMIVVKHICYGIWGKTVFLTREEAEVAIAERKRC